MWFHTKKIRRQVCLEPDLYVARCCHAFRSSCDVALASPMSASPHCVDDYLLLSKSVPVIPRYGHQMYSVFLWETWLEKQAETIFFLPNLACRDRSQIIDLDRGPGHRSVNPKNFFFVVAAVLHFTSFPFSFFFSPVS